MSNHAEIIIDLRNQWFAKRVAIGQAPDWLTDYPGLIEAFVPDVAGIAKPAVY